MVSGCRPKALVVEDDPRTREAIDEVLTALGHEYDTATCLVEATKQLKANGYTYILLNCRIPARLGGTPRAQNTEKFLESLAEVKGQKMPPVIIMLPPETAYAGITHEASVRWAAGVLRRGAVDFIARPFPTEGRTLDRVIKKVLAGKVEPVLMHWTTAERPARCQAEAPPAASGDAAQDAGRGTPAQEEAAGSSAWSGIANDSISLDEFMVKFCEPKSKGFRISRKRKLLAAARHRTINLPPPALATKHGQANRYATHELLNAWQGFLDNGVDLPRLRAMGAPDQASPRPSV